MPYKGVDDASLPDNVKALADDKKAQWVEVFNSAYAKCTEGGGSDCEQSAFAQAWGVVNQEKEAQAEELAETPEEPEADLTSKIKDFLSMLEKALKDLLGIPSEEAPAEEVPSKEEAKEQSTKPNYLPLLKDRSVSFPAIYDQAYLQIQAQDQVAMMYDIYYDTAGLFAICASNGKLYKVPVTVKDGTVSLGAWEEIIVTQSRKPSFRILRNKEGKYRWISISATATLNRVGEIDSRQLFDNMIKRAEQTGNYPIRVFFHAGQKFRTGQCDFLGRDENVLITSGLYDQSELAMREVKARLEEPEFWGDSISFYPMVPAQKIRAGETEIPVYTDGIFEEISTLPEQDAASWLTATPTILEVQRMLNQRQMAAFIKLFDDDEEEAKKWLEANSAQRNRIILDTGMVTRAKRELAELIEGNELNELPQPTDVKVPETTPEPEPTETTVESAFELDETALNAIADQVVQRMDSVVTPLITTAITNALTPLSERLEVLEAKFNQTTDETTQTITQAISRLDLLSKDESKKKREWLADLPAKPKTQVTYRPSQERTSDRDPVAEETLSRAPVKY